MSKELDALELFLKNARKLETCGGLPEEEEEEEEEEGFRKFVIKLVTDEWFLAGHFEPALFEDFWEITFLDEEEFPFTGEIELNLNLESKDYLMPISDGENIILIDPKKISFIYPF